MCVGMMMRGQILSEAWLCLIGDAISAYMIIRAFSWQLRLSPVMFEEFAAALFANHPSPFLDEVWPTTCLPILDSQLCAQKLQCCQPASAGVMKAPDGTNATHAFPAAMCCLLTSRAPGAYELPLDRVSSKANWLACR